MKLTIALLVALSAIARGARAADAEPRYFSVRPGVLVEAKARLAAGDQSLQPALQALVERADKALKVKPPTVMDKTKPAPSGSLHDYYSTAPYFWPDPARSNGLPYIAHDGKVNPESRTAASDEQRVGTLGGTVDALALAYYFTGKAAYAEHAARCLRVWFLDPATRMTPHLDFAQAIPGINDGRGIGIIECGGIIGAVEASGLLAGSPAWPAKDDQALRDWAAQFLDWLRTSKNGMDESREKQNHGTMYDVRVTTLALILGQTELAKQVTETAKAKRIAVQIEPDGRQPLELKRTKSFNYSRLNLRGLVALAGLADQVDVDLWHYETADGRSIRKALDFMLPYVKTPPEKWPYQQIIPMDRSELFGAFRSAAIAYREPRYVAVFAGEPGGERGAAQLLNPLPSGLLPTQPAPKPATKPAK